MPPFLTRHTASSLTQIPVSQTAKAVTRLQRGSRCIAAGTAAAQGTTRRDAIAAVAAATAAVLLVRPEPVVAAEDGTARARYVDPQDGFSLELPSGWLLTEGALPGNNSFTGSSGSRRTLAWYPADAPAGGTIDTSVTLTITNTSAEFTKLGSFGNVYAFGTNLVNSMDRGFLRRGRADDGEPVQLARLVDAAETRGMYSVEYTVTKQPGPTRHLWSVVALAFNGRYNRLYTLTAQCMEGDVAAYESALRGVLQSFVPPAAAA